MVEYVTETYGTTINNYLISRRITRAKQLLRFTDMTVDEIGNAAGMGDGMFAVNGILFNHESERRGENFVTRKITLAAGRIAEGLQDHLELGNMDSLRDWGYAKDYVECMWLIMQQDKPEDFVIATGVQHTVRDFTEKAFAANGITIRWEGSGIEEKGYDVATGKMLVCVNPQWFRPTDVDNLWGDPTKAKTVLGWNPQSTTYEQLVEIMAKHDRERAKREKAMKAVL